MNGRGMLAAAVLAAWGAGIAIFAQREATRSPMERLAESAVRIAPGPTYFAVSEEERHVGFSSFTTDTIPDGLQFTEYEVREVRAVNASGRRVRQVVSRASRALALREVVVSAGGPIATATVLDDSTLLVIREGASGVDTTRERYAKPLLLPSLVPLAVALGEAPSIGDRHAYDVFDPTTLRVRRLSVTLVAESTLLVVDSAAFDASARRWRAEHTDTVQAWRLVEDRAPGLDLWVDALGRTVSSQENATTTHVRTSYEMAFENWRSIGRASGDSVTAPMATMTRVRGAARLARLTLVARGLPIARLAVTAPWQRIVGETIHVSVPVATPRPSGYWLPTHRDFRARHRGDLKVEPGMEVESPAIAGAARRLRNGQADPHRFAETLLRWVSDSIRLEPTLTPPSALTTMRSAAGDADHHTLLYIALARAAGIPARAARGLVRHDDAWLSHSWAEVFVGGDWLPVDPTSGQFPADAAHVRLVLGFVGIAPELERLVSRATLTVVSLTPVTPAPQP